MTAISNRYVHVLNDHKILYMPSCLIVEMLTRLYSQVSSIGLSGETHQLVPDLLVLLRRMTESIDATAGAYRGDRIRFFIGDWKEDKLRARKLFFNVMSRLGYITTLLGEHERAALYKACEDMTESWAELDRIMAEKSDMSDTQIRTAACGYFRCHHPDNWRQVMANIILALDEQAEYDDAKTYLLLLCYKRVKTELARAIEDLERRKCAPRRFDVERLLFISNEDPSLTCPKCVLMTESLPLDETEAIRRKQTIAQKKVSQRIRTRHGQELRGRYPMPPSLAGFSRM